MTVDGSGEEVGGNEVSKEDKGRNQEMAREGNEPVASSETRGWELTRSERGQGKDKGEVRLCSRRGDP
jgi:hypothetical protein